MFRLIWALPVLALCWSLVSCSCPDADRCISDYVGPGANGLVCSPSAAGTTMPGGLTQRVTASAATSQPLSVSVCQAIALALENNRSFNVQRYSPSITRTNEQVQLAAFDPILNANYTFSRNVVDRVGTSIGDTSTTDVDLSQFFCTGTTIDLNARHNFAWTNHIGDQQNTRAGLTVTQALLRGYGCDVNLVSLHQAQISSVISDYELRGQAETLVASVENAYWDYALALEQINISLEAVKVAKQNLYETQERINVGKLAETELAAAQAEVAIQEEGLINARSAADKARLALLRLMSPPDGPVFDRPVTLLDKPEAPGVHMDPVENHVAVGEMLRPDMNQARLQVKQNELQIIKTKNGLLPVLNAFVTLGKTGYSRSFIGTITNMTTEGSYDIQAGAVFQYPLYDRAQKATNLAAVLTKQQSEEALKNLQQSVDLDVRDAYIEVNRSREQVTATAVTLRAQEETYRAENEKLRVGKSTTFLVSQAYRDLVTAQTNQVAAVVSYLKSFVNLYELEGSLLKRRGVHAPGCLPVCPLGVESETLVRPPCTSPPPK